ncbi:hypothetical protein [Marinobacter sp. S6332]|uniref:hypothetical protein n=1 Tax=Marinobacter sp. S6332 TaxID=2926403 RepID=UPI001FF195D9|nr:hypothetical protein [Marinobacter sp. S6332]MCK0165737.1 hypothetical protein [Marinobacter sp. S6332]
MSQIYMSAQRVVEAAEQYEQFYEVELAITIRTDDGRKSELIRLRSETPALTDEKFKESKPSDHVEF